MQEIVDFFATIPSNYRTALLVTGLVAFWIAEGTVPLFPFRKGRVRHAATNLALTVFQLLIAVAMGSVLVRAAQFADEHEWGLLRVFDLPLFAEVIGGIVILDFFVGYVSHRLQHSVPFLWRIHIVHHSDPHVDVTTGLRHHPIETLIRITFMLIATLTGGISIGVIFMYQTAAVFFAQLTHANVTIVPKVDRAFARLFVSPNMHKVHHHFRKPWTNTNYGNVFSVWDRLLGTFVEVDPHELTYGIDSIPLPEQNSRLPGILQTPFRSSSAGQSEARTELTPKADDTSVANKNASTDTRHLGD